MTNEELENKIAEKFVRIMRKIRNLVVGHLIQNCSPYFKTLIMACMKMMDEEKINFTMSHEDRQATNDMFQHFGVPDRIRVVPNFSDTTPLQKQMEYNIRMLKDNRKLERIYNLLDNIDILLCAKDFYDKMQTIGELAQQLDNEYKDSKND